MCVARGVGSSQAPEAALSQLLTPVKVSHGGGGVDYVVREPGWDPGHSSLGQVWCGAVVRHRQGVLLPFQPPTLRTPGVGPQISSITEMMPHIVSLLCLHQSFQETLAWAFVGLHLCYAKLWR